MVLPQVAFVDLIFLFIVMRSLNFAAVLKNTYQERQRVMAL